MSPRISRRGLLRLCVMGGAGLTLGLRYISRASAAGGSAVLHPLVQITPGGKINLFAQNPEMGQGVKTSLPMILAEELDVRLADVSVRQADWLPGQDLQFSGGSLSVRLNYKALRQAGAAARQMLLRAAAARWQLPLASLTTADGRVRDASGRRVAAYGELAADAARLQPPTDPTLKSERDFRVIGKSHSDVDLRRIISGQPLFGLDLELPGMLYAVVRRCPVSDGQLRSFNKGSALGLPGVRAVYALSNQQHGGRIIQPNNPNFVSGVAVLADSTWAAIRAARALEVEWRYPEQLENTDALYERFHAGLESAAVRVRRDGGPERLLGAQDDIFTAIYQVPLLAHAPMEPMNCSARFHDGKIEIWAPTQNPGDLAQAVGKALKLGPEAVVIHVLRSGGAFGRRYYSDFAIDTALLASMVKRPVKVVWTREDDLRHDYFRPAGVHRIRAALDKRGRISAWHHKLAGHSRAAFLQREDPPADTELDPYTFPAGLVPNLLFEHVHIPSRIPLGQWRAVSASSNVFVIGSAIDELAHRAGADPLEFLLQLLGERDQVRVTERFSLDVGRLRRVIRQAATAAGWHGPHGWRDGEKRCGRGIAACYDQGAWVAQVAQVSINADRLQVDRIVAAVDCGRVINPQGARAQVEGSILDGLSVALMGEITLRDGVVGQSNFHDYPLLRIDQAPRIEILFADSGKEPRGLGEPALPPVAAAVCNAVFAATGKRIRQLPLTKAFKV